jgi:hypothetical protein
MIYERLDIHTMAMLVRYAVAARLIEPLKIASDKKTMERPWR